MIRRTAAVALALAACSSSAPPPAAPSTPPDPSRGHWTVDEHVIGPHADIGEPDARAMHARTIDIDVGYTTPWHGSCPEAKHDTTPFELGSVSSLVGIDLAPLHLPPSLDEYAFTCTDNNRAPPLKLYVGDGVAVTCWNGVCYRLARGR